MSERWTRLAHGSWTTAWSVQIGDERYFAKTAPLARAAMLDAEADGLRALGACAIDGLVVPRVHSAGKRGEEACLVMSWLELGESRRDARLGTALAALHRSPAGARYGWAVDNYIGGTEQQNGWRDDWADFFCERRLRPQLARAGLDHARLLPAARALLREHSPPPSLLHGDLWSGNASLLADGRPAIFDPAVYVGDREADIAMAHLFGGFDRTFYRAYEHAWPLPAGHELRRDLYDLYHVLNHLNLFGASYRAQADRLIARIVEA